jgi:hypothetical protein
MGALIFVIASHALHKTRNIGRALTNVRKILKPGGRLTMVETTQDTLDAQMIFGTLPEWWSSEEKERVSSPHLASQQWNNALRRTGFNGLDVNVADCKDQKSHVNCVCMSTAVMLSPPTLNTQVAIVIGLSKSPDAWLKTLKQSLAEATGLMPEVTSIDEVKPADKIYLVLADIDEAIILSMEAVRFNTIQDFVGGAKGVPCTRLRGTRKKSALRAPADTRR